MNNRPNPPQDSADGAGDQESSHSEEQQLPSDARDDYNDEENTETRTIEESSETDQSRLQAPVDISELQRSPIEWPAVGEANQCASASLQPDEAGSNESITASALGSQNQIFDALNLQAGDITGMGMQNLLPLYGQAAMRRDVFLDEGRRLQIHNMLLNAGLSGLLSPLIINQNQPGTNVAATLAQSLLSRQPATASHSTQDTARTGTIPFESLQHQQSALSDQLGQNNPPLLHGRGHSETAEGSTTLQRNETDSRAQPGPTIAPCRARGMPHDHNATTAFFIIPPGTEHGAELLCSHDACRRGGVKFCYCVACGIPVAKRNFRVRHLHDFYEPQPLPVGPQGSLSRQTGSASRRTVSESTSSASRYGNQQNSQMEAGRHQGGQSQSANQELAGQPGSLARLQGDGVPVAAQENAGQAAADSLAAGDAAGNTEGRNLQIAQWLNLLRTRPSNSEGLQSLVRWLHAVLMVSDPHYPSVEEPTVAQDALELFQSFAEPPVVETETSRSEHERPRGCEESPANVREREECSEEDIPINMAKKRRSEK